MATKVGTSTGMSKSIGAQVEGTHENIGVAGSEKPDGWMNGHKNGDQVLKKAKGRGGNLPRGTDSGEL